MRVVIGAIGGISAALVATAMMQSRLDHHKALRDRHLMLQREVEDAAREVDFLKAPDDGIADLPDVGKRIETLLQRTGSYVRLSCELDQLESSRTTRVVMFVAGLRPVNHHEEGMTIVRACGAFANMYPLFLEWRYLPKLIPDERHQKAWGARLDALLDVTRDMSPANHCSHPRAWAEILAYAPAVNDHDLLDIVVAANIHSSPLLRECAKRWFGSLHELVAATVALTTPAVDVSGGKFVRPRWTVDNDRQHWRCAATGLNMKPLFVLERLRFSLAHNTLPGEAPDHVYRHY